MARGKKVQTDVAAKQNREPLAEARLPDAEILVSGNRDGEPATAPMSFFVPVDRLSKYTVRITRLYRFQTIVSQSETNLGSTRVPGTEP